MTEVDAAAAQKLYARFSEILEVAVRVNTHADDLLAKYGLMAEKLENLVASLRAMAAASRDDDDSDSDSEDAGSKDNPGASVVGISPDVRGRLRTGTYLFYVKNLNRIYAAQYRDGNIEAFHPLNETSNGTVRVQELFAGGPVKYERGMGLDTCNSNALRYTGHTDSKGAPHGHGYLYTPTANGATPRWYPVEFDHGRVIKTDHPAFNTAAPASPPMPIDVTD